jgi:hypothetical protein
MLMLQDCAEVGERLSIFFDGSCETVEPLEAVYFFCLSKASGRKGTP